MARHPTEAWVTWVAADDEVPGAARVLAASWRHTHSTRHLVALTHPTQVSAKGRESLEQLYDRVVVVPEEVAPQIYAFSLLPFTKCVFLPVSSLFLENADVLFEGDSGDFASRAGTTRAFVFRPCKQVYGQLRQGGGAGEEYLAHWMDNQRGVLRLGEMREDVLLDFCLEKGVLEKSCVAPRIVHFREGKKRDGSLSDKMRRLREAGRERMTMVEKSLVERWLEMEQEAPQEPFSSSGEVYRNEPIAIVGMSCRYPGAKSVQEFWNMLYEGEEGIREPPAFRWTKEHTVRVTPQDRKAQAGFLAAAVDEFDARFFGVSPKEAAYMDPQTRIMHEVLWEALEDAGINPLSLYGTHAGIFTGSWMNDYKDIVAHSAERDFFRTYMGNSIGASAARLSFLLGLTGPSIATESGCSSAIVAVDLAVKSLRNGETNLAMAGGVNLLLHPFNSSMMEYVISPDGRCKTFDAKADGFGRAEGCGVLVLKRLSDALRDRDNIWATIRGSAVSQEGLSRSLGTPTVHCEALAMQLALKDANVEPERVSFVETHGTGTSVGDPMEVSAISRAYYSPHRKEPLVIGSVKTNVGHTESCSGITGIMKAVLAMQHETIPKHRNLETLNPEIFLDPIPAIIPTENLPWPKIAGQPRICGVSSFGITGTDGHVILEEAPENTLPKFSLGMERPTHLLTISGKSREALEQLLQEYEDRFAGTHDGDQFPSAAYTANVGRAAFNHRAFLVSRDFGGAASILREGKFLRGELKEGHNPQICFLFTGQGSQYAGMAKTLYETSPVFRTHFEVCDRALRKLCHFSLAEVLWEGDAKELSRTIYSQTSIFCVEYCLLKLWQSWGVQPNLVLGHSLGEFCAAVAAGILDFEDALKLVAERSRLIDNLPRGSMLVVKASKPEVDKLMKNAKIDLDFAAINSPEQTVVAGDTKTVESFLAYLKSQNVKAIILEATHAFHSRHMDPMLEQYRKVAQTIKFKRGNPNIQYVSGMEGRIIEDASEMEADYWVRHTREKVSFIDACVVLKESGCQDFLEVGPQPVLSSFVMMNNEDGGLNCLPSLRRGQDDWETMLTSLGKLYLLGYSIDWKAYDEPYIRQKVSLPFHPFHRKPFWVESTPDSTTLIHPLVGGALKNASALNIFQSDLTLKSLPYLKDHCIGSRVVFPGAGYTEMCLSAAYCVANGLTDTFEQPTRPMRLENLRIDAPLELKEGKSCRLQVIVDLPEESEKQEETSSGFRVKVFHQNANNSEESGKWVLHASSNFLPVASTQEAMSHWNPTHIEDIMSGNPHSPESFYKKVDEQGLRFGETFRMIRRYWTQKQPDCKEDTDEVVTEIALPSDWNKYLLHPLIIDAGFQTGILTRYPYESSKLKVPVRIGELTLLSGVNSPAGGDAAVLFMHVRTAENGLRRLFICTADLTPLVHVNHVEFIDTNVRAIESVLEQQSSAVPDAWEEVWRVIPSPFTSSLAQPVKMAALTVPPAPEEGHAERQQYEQIQTLIYLYIVGALQTLGWTPQVGGLISLESLCNSLAIQPEFRQLVRFYLRQLETEGVLASRAPQQWTVVQPLPSPEQVDEHVTNLTAALKTGGVATSAQIWAHIAIHLPRLLRGEESSLSLLFPLEPEKQVYSAETFYQNHPSRGALQRSVYNIGNAICHQSRQLNGQTEQQSKVYRVLEVGSGTGSMSGLLLRGLHEVWGSHFELYYTDISHTFFIKAEKKFEEFRENLRFAVFNLEQSPLSQGIPLEYFDMVCGTDVLHATRNLEETLVHLRQTLKPGGVLLFTETIVPARDITYVFGLLEGYWRFEDKQWRPEHCCVSVPVWTQLLERSGFGQVTAAKTFSGQFACISAVAEETAAPIIPRPPRKAEEEERKEWLVFGREENLELTLPLAQMLQASGYHVEMVTSKEEARIPERRKLQGIIYGWGMIPEGVDNQEDVALPLLELVQGLVTLPSMPALLVVTRGVHAVLEDATTRNPSAATLFGMVKSLKNENGSMVLRYVDLDQAASAEEMVAQVIYEVAMTRTPQEAQRLQVAYRGAVRYEPRLVKANLNTQSDALKLPPSTDRYKLRLPETRVIQDLEFEPLEQTPLEEKEVEVKVQSFALNFRDIFAILKPSAEFEKLNGVGLDFSGVVTKAGEKARWKVGERVFGANFKDGQLPSHLSIDAQAVLRVPDNMTHCEAATLPAVFLTAYHCLINVAKMGKEDTVLIHTASGGVGLAAIQLAKQVGAQIITTAGNPRKRAYLRSLGVKHVFHSRDLSYEQEILRVTHGRGVDLVLNSITGPGVKEATLRATARNGRFIEMSKLNVWTPEEVKNLRPDVGYQIVDLTVLDGDTNRQLLESMEGCLAAGHLKPIPCVQFDALHIRQALQYFQKARHIGKVVVTMPEVKQEGGKFIAQVPLFNRESTYLITGGLGGIGFEVCKWMLNLGAQDIVLMGRSPPKPDILEQISKLNKSGANVTVRLGDVGDLTKCKDVIEGITASMKPLRGVMHCAGVLRDNLYAKQSWPDFEATYTPKIQGTWNLHNLTKSCPLEHFVVYSSLTALMGTPGQPNHASANCFEDAFIHYRHSLGLPGTTINWGQWAQVGVAKEVSISGILPVSVQRMLNGLEIALKSQKRQVCFSDFDSFHNLSMLCPMIRHYLDKRLWQQFTGSSSTNSQAPVNADQFWKDMDGVATQPEKVGVMTAYLKAILRAALRLEADEPIGEDANIQELGVDSLMMIELKNSIQSLLGSRLTINAGVLKNCNTIRQLAHAVVSRLFESDEGEDTDQVALEPLSAAELRELLSGDAVLPETVRLSPNALEAVKPSQIKVVLVTGATGQVAPYLIAELLKSYPSVAKIYCLVRGPEPEERLRQALAHVTPKSTGNNNNKIEAIAGNVTQENLDLSPETYAQLASQVDAIFHCAAKTHPFEHFRFPASPKGRDIRSVNVLGTVNILRFASTGKAKHVFYPSTLLSGIFGANVDARLADTWPDSGVIDSIVHNRFLGLQSSKWVGEMLLRQANDRGVPCKVFRLPWVGGESQTGRVDPLKNLYILRYLSFLKMGAMPDVVLPANLLPIDTLAELSLRLFMSDQTPNEIFNLAHPSPQVEQEFVSLARKEFGKQVEILDQEQLTQRLEQQQPQREELVDLFNLQKVVTYYFGHAAEFVAGYVDAPHEFFRNEKVSRHLDNYGHNFPSAMHVLRQDLRYIKENTGVWKQLHL